MNSAWKNITRMDGGNQHNVARVGTVHQVGPLCYYHVPAATHHKKAIQALY
jgi:hypothetical protein